ncbi:MAG: diacylglycerol kinase family protein [Sellimonas intestinalis]
MGEMGRLDEGSDRHGRWKRGERLRAGYIPTGTTNDFANSLHIPKDLLSAADGQPVNGNPFHR